MRRNRRRLHREGAGGPAGFFPEGSWFFMALWASAPPAAVMLSTRRLSMEGEKEDKAALGAEEAKGKASSLLSLSKGTPKRTLLLPSLPGTCNELGGGERAGFPLLILKSQTVGRGHRPGGNKALGSYLGRRVRALFQPHSPSRAPFPSSPKNPRSWGCQDLSRCIHKHLRCSGGEEVTGLTSSWLAPKAVGGGPNPVQSSGAGTAIPVGCVGGGATEASSRDGSFCFLTLGLHYSSIEAGNLDSIGPLFSLAQDQPTTSLVFSRSTTGLRT